MRAGVPLKKWMFPFSSVRWKPQVSDHLWVIVGMTLKEPALHRLSGRSLLLPAHEVGRPSILRSPTWVYYDRVVQYYLHLTIGSLQDNFGSRDP